MEFGWILEDFGRFWREMVGRTSRGCGKYLEDFGGENCGVFQNNDWNNNKIGLKFWV